MFLALELDHSLDLGQFSRLLWQRKLSHHIVDQGEQQLVLVAEQNRVMEVRELFRLWQQGAVAPQDEDSSSLSGFVNTGKVRGSAIDALRQAPLTVFLTVLCCVLWLVAPLEAPTALTLQLLYPDFSLGTGTIVLSRVLQSFGVTDLFRMLSPVLLHGGLVHLVFNMVWLWELGRRIERVQRSSVFAVAIAVIALFSNTIQYLYGGGNNFGGMSGVIYGLFAYIWCWQLFDPRKGLALPGALILYMIASLLIFTWLGLDMIANAAHMGGFLTGMVYGAIVAIASRLLRNLRERSS